MEQQTENLTPPVPQTAIETVKRALAIVRHKPSKQSLAEYRAALADYVYSQCEPDPGHIS